MHEIPYNSICLKKKIGITKETIQMMSVTSYEPHNYKIFIVPYITKVFIREPDRVPSCLTNHQQEFLEPKPLKNCYIPYGIELLFVPSKNHCHQYIGPVVFLVAFVIPFLVHCLWIHKLPIITM